MESPFARALTALLRPLEFAGRDGGRGLARVRDLERAVAAAGAAARGLAIPRDARDRIERAVGPFARPLPEPEARRGAVERALQLLRPLAEPAFAAAELCRPVASLPGVGPKRAQRLAARGLASLEDLLFHLPVGYDDRRRLCTIAELQVGRRATFAGRVQRAEFTGRPARARGGGRPGGRLFEVVVGDDTGSVRLKWFRGGDAIARTARKDALLLVTGDVQRYRFDLELRHPELDPLEDDGAPGAPRRVVPEYATPEGVHPRLLRRCIGTAVASCSDLVAGFLPAAAARGLPEPAAALRALHDPPEGADAGALRERSAPAWRRLVLEELYLLELGLALRRGAARRERAPALECGGPRARAAAERLPFRLTGAQRRAWGELRADLSRPAPMNRLLEGDVGSGKTVLAYLAAVAVAENGAQSALMAPTELLAEQHLRTLERLAAASGAGLRLGLLTASLSAPEARQLRAGLSAGEVDLVVGTHALLQEGVAFRRLALVVTDEQHRFGVRQRALLRKPQQAGRRPAHSEPKASEAHRAAPVPHTLVMTATPIPRTLALTLHGDLDLSVLDELPPGRTPVETLLLRSGEGQRAADLLRAAVARGEQVYVVYPLVAESEKSDLRSAEAGAERIRAAWPDLRVDLVHGRLDAVARGRAMARFEAGETQVLVATTVVEVGVDVENATLMIVEHAERFGLAQLHQLRGRVGRGSRPGTCALVARGGGEDSEARLGALLETCDGFRIADADLRIRGPGEFLGTRQHGHWLDLRVADLVLDRARLVEAREAALATAARDPGLRGAPALARAVRARWGERLALADVG